MKKCSTTEETYTVIEKKGQSINIERESDMQENINFIVAIVTSLITMCTLIYNTFFKGGFKREKQYYNKILIPFIEALKAGNENALQEIKDQINHTDECVPKYVIHLINTSQIQTDNTITDKKLLKVFIYDYLDIYPNDDNRMDQLPCIILKIFTYFKFFLAFLFLMVGNMYLFIIINSFLQYGMDNGFISSFTSNIRRIDCFEILRAVICYGLYVAVIFWAKNSNIDRYTTRKKKIEKMICRKVKAYDKRNDKYVSFRCLHSKITVKISNRTASRTFHANTDSNHRFTGYCILHLSLPIDLLCLHVQRTKQKATKTEERKIKSVPFHKHYF